MQAYIFKAIKIFKMDKCLSTRRSLLDKLVDIFIFITLGATFFANFRLTGSGPVISAAGGTPFVYEIGLVFLLLTIFLKFRRGTLILSKKQKMALLFLNLFYAPIFIVYIVFSFDLYQFIGGGQLRLQLEAWLFGIALLVYPLDKVIIKRVLTLIVVMALVNGLYAILSSYGILTPLYKLAMRSYGLFRYSGFFETPGVLGVVSVIAISWAIWMSPNLYISVVVVLICSYAILIADSRTGVVAVFLIIATRIYFNRKISKLILIVILLFTSAFFVITLNSILANPWFRDEKRLVSICNAILIWMDNPVGIPWGEFNQFNRNLIATSPHNWPAVSLLHGGLISFSVVVISHYWNLRNYWKFSLPRSDYDQLIVGNTMIMLAISFSSWTEQILQAAPALFVYIFSFAATIHCFKMKKMAYVLYNKKV